MNVPSSLMAAARPSIDQAIKKDLTPFFSRSRRWNGLKPDRKKLSGETSLERQWHRRTRRDRWAVAVDWSMNEPDVWDSQMRPAAVEHFAGEY
jgi:hypothetical protein